MLVWEGGSESITNRINRAYIHVFIPIRIIKVGVDDDEHVVLVVAIEMN